MFKITHKNIFEEARKGNIAILEHSLVDKIKDCYGETPLHWLASGGRVEILKHPSVGKVSGAYNRTPLHELAIKGKLEVLNHEAIDKVKDLRGWTPLHFIADGVGKLYKKGFKKWLKRKYPWFQLGSREITYDLIDEILNTPNACRFIYSL